MSEQAEASTVLVANVAYVRSPILVFVRLKASRVLGNLNEISLPVKCLFLLLSPEEAGDEGFHIGRTIGVLMSDDGFASHVYQCQVCCHLLFQN
jgi:Band 3 cytoplasmic domain.